MAHSVDNFKDLEELGIDCDSNDNLTYIFNEAANHLQTLLPNVDNQTLLTLYGYYKQGTEGVCNIPKPSWYDMKGKSKWEAWNKLGDMPSHEAKQLYIETIKKLDPNFESGDASPSSSSSTTNKESWVRVSVPQFEDNMNESEKTLTDYVKEGDYQNVEKSLKDILNVQQILNLRSAEGLCVIHWAADRGKESILRLLIDSGADINARDVDGQTALHYASSCGHKECVKLLLSKGADAYIKDDDGLSALAVASDDYIKEMLSSWYSYNTRVDL